MLNLKHIVGETGLRLDKYLAAEDLATSRSEAQAWINDARVHVNGRPAKGAYVVQAGDEISINKPDIKSLDLTPQDLQLDVRFEDEHLLVINKPAGLVVHPGPGNYETSLVHGLLHHCKGTLSGINGVERPGIVHRLDKGTSGLILVCKTDVAHQKMAQQFQDRLVEKEYRALALYEIAQQEQTLEDLMKRSELNRKKFVVNQKKGKRAVTHVKVLQKTDKCSYVHVKIETGRTHQIRVHLKHIGHPIMGDETYGGTTKLKGFDPEDTQWIKGLGHPLLHSHRLAFEHPVTHQKIDVSCDIPADFQDAIARFLS